MKITKNIEGAKLTVALEGRLDTTTAPELEQEVMSSLDGINELVLDLTDLMYMSSAGLRVVLACQKKMNAVAGSMIVKNVNDLIMEVFDTTGFMDILTIEN